MDNTFSDLLCHLWDNICINLGEIEYEDNLWNNLQRNLRTNLMVNLWFILE